MNRLTLLAFFSILFSFGVCASPENTNKEQPKVKKVHYRVVNIENFANGKAAAKQVEEYLNKQAAQGYQLDLVIDTSSENDTKLLVMKKESR